MHHGAGLRQLLIQAGKTSAEAEKYFNQICNYDLGADFSKQDIAMLTYAENLTRMPAGITKSDIEELKQQGFSELAIHDIAAITGYFAFVNRLADGLGVELEKR